MNNQIQMARLFAIGAFICGLIGLIAGAANQTWRLTIVGWFTAGTLLAVLALFVLIDQHLASRRDASG